MLNELMVSILCVVSFFFLGWIILLRIKMEELEKKMKALEEYFQTKKKLDNI